MRITLTHTTNIFQFHFVCKKNYLQTHIYILCLCIYVYMFTTIRLDLNKLSNHWQTRECGHAEERKVDARCEYDFPYVFMHMNCDLSANHRTQLLSSLTLIRAN